MLHKKIRIIDFDGVIFNSKGKYGKEFLIENIKNKSFITKIDPKNLYDGSYNVLVSGRNKEEGMIIAKVLGEMYGYYFVEYHFSDFTDSDFKSSNFYSKYLDYKMGKFALFETNISTVTDDEERVIDLAKKMGFKTKHIKEFLPELILE